LKIGLPPKLNIQGFHKKCFLYNKKRKEVITMEFWKLFRWARDPGDGDSGGDGSDGSGMSSDGSDADSGGWDSADSGSYEG